MADDLPPPSGRFGPDITYYFGGNPLNRLSFLRTDSAFLNSAFGHPSTAFVLLHNLAPLTDDSARPSSLSLVGAADVAPLTGLDPFKSTDEELIHTFNSAEVRPLIVFLGVDEADTAGGFAYRDYTGRPYFAVDVTPQGQHADAAKQVIDTVEKKGLVFFTQARSAKFSDRDAAIFALARALTDWNVRNPFCAGCGQPTLSINAGTKRVCPPTDLAGAAEGGSPRERPACPTRGRGVSNLSFPRTDAVVIAAVLSRDGSRLLLGRKAISPGHRYSCLAGFLEPGEAAEDAVRREVWEESGVRVGRVAVLGTQPWPFPANLMIGAIAQAADVDGAEDIHLGHDPELEGARWFTLDEVRAALKHGASGLGEPASDGYPEDGLRIPPPMAIANRLMRAVVDGYVF